MIRKPIEVIDALVELLPEWLLAIMMHFGNNISNTMFGADLWSSPSEYTKSIDTVLKTLYCCESGRLP